MTSDNNNNELMMVVVIVAASLFATTTPVAVYAQQQGEVFESEDDGFRLQVPQGWVIEDFENEIDPADPNLESLAVLCLENEALPGIGGEHNCQAANRTASFLIARWPDLQSMPEFRNESDSSGNSTIIPTTNDLVALWIQYTQSDASEI